MKGLRPSKAALNGGIFSLEISPVYEGIKTLNNGEAGEITGLEISPVYEGIKTLPHHQ